LLDGIGFHWGWTPDPNTTAETAASWESNFSKLQEYQEKSGNCDVPMEPLHRELGTWARVQRFQYNLYGTKRKSFITRERIKQVNDIGFDWKGPRKIE
jgi:Helicase associated domain